MPLRYGLIALTLVALGCSTTSGSEFCPPGNQAQCTCGNGVVGEQTCDGAGTAYGACSCVVSQGDDGGTQDSGATSPCPVGTCLSAEQSMGICPAAGASANLNFTISCQNCGTPDSSQCGPASGSGAQFCCKP